MEFDLLNLEPHKISESLEGTCFVYGNPKVGKSTFCTKLYSKEHYGDGKECLLLAFEKGYQFLNVTALDITKYSDLRKVIRQLKDDRVKARYGTIIFDTVDIFAKLAEKYVCSTKGVNDISDIPYGGGWKLLDEAIENIILEIQREGYGICFISHAAVKSSMDGTDKSKITPTVSRRVGNLVMKFSDHILYLSSESDEEGVMKRYINVRETEDFVAGSRLIGLPSRIDLDIDKFKEEVKKAVNGAGELTTEAESMPIFEEVDYDKVMDAVVKLVTEIFMPNDMMDFVKDTTDKILGKDIKIADTTKDQAESLSIIFEILEERAEKLGLI